MECLLILRPCICAGKDLATSLLGVFKLCGRRYDAFNTSHPSYQARESESLVWTAWPHSCMLLASLRWLGTCLNDTVFRNCSITELWFYKLMKRQKYGFEKSWQNGFQRPSQTKLFCEAVVLLQFFINTLHPLLLAACRHWQARWIFLSKVLLPCSHAIHSICGVN